MFGYYRLASSVPQLRVAEVDYNVDQLTEEFRKAAEQQAAAVVFPELCITGYSCGDLFFQPNLRKAALNGLLRFTEATEGSGTIAVVGLPFLHEDALYNTAAVVQSGRILALVPKTVLPNYREFYEKRQFTSGRELGTGAKEVTVNGMHIPFGTEIVFHEESSPFSFGVEICEDLWSVIPPSSKLALLGARAILNPSAGTELTGKAAYRRELVRQQSGRCLCAYVLSSAGVHESTTDTVFGGHSLIADNGRPAAEGERFCRESTLIFADVDFERLEAARLSESSFNDSKSLFPAGNALHLTPRIGVLGIGCRRGTTVEQLEAAFSAFCAAHTLAPQCIAAAASIDLKQNEAGLLAFCAAHRWGLSFFSAEALQTAPGSFTPSAFVRNVTGVDNVCERAAVLASGGSIRIPKQAGGGVTFALALSPFAPDWRVLS